MMVALEEMLEVGFGHSRAMILDGNVAQLVSPKHLCSPEDEAQRLCWSAVLFALAIFGCWMGRH